MDQEREAVRVPDEYARQYWDWVETQLDEWNEPEADGGGEL